MKKIGKNLTLAFTALMLTGLLAGCGNTEKIGYVDVAKIRTESVKAKIIETQVAERQSQMMQQLTELQAKETPEKFQQEAARLDEEMNIYRLAMSKEFKNAIEASTADVAREKKMTMVVDRYAIPGGGEDITAEVLAKMDAAAKEQKAVMDKAKAAAQQEVNKSQQETGEAKK